MQNPNGLKVDSVKKNFIYQSSYQLLSLILPLVTAPYISRVLGTTGTGVYSYASSVLYYFTMVANLGISNYGNREIAANIDDKSKLSKTFCGIFCCHAILSLICTIVYYFYIAFLVKEYKDAFLWQSFQMFATLFDITWFFSGIQIFKITVRRNFVIRILTVVSIFALIKTREDTWKYLAILAIGNLIGQLAVWTQLKKYVVFVRIEKKDVLIHIKPMFILFIPVIAMSIYRYMDKIMIPHFSNISELGLYENAEKIISLPLSLITTVGVVLLPKMSTIASQGDTKERNRYFNTAMKFSLILALGLAGGLIGIAEVFAPQFFGDEFKKCGELITLLAVTVLFLTWSNSIRSQYLIPNKKDKAFIVAAFSGAAVNFFLNIFLISLFGAKGAAYATIGAELIVAVIHTIYSYKELPFGEIIKQSWIFAIPALAMSFIVRCMGQLYNESYIILFIQIVTGAVFYLGIVLLILVIQKDEIILPILKKKFIKNNNIEIN